MSALKIVLEAIEVYFYFENNTGPCVRPVADLGGAKGAMPPPNARSRPLP